ncbi:hypothetical protein V8E36_002269 [Tilletia maclaganii]
MLPSEPSASTSSHKRHPLEAEVDHAADSPQPHKKLHLDASNEAAAAAHSSQHRRSSHNPRRSYDGKRHSSGGASSRNRAHSNSGMPFTAFSRLQISPTESQAQAQAPSLFHPDPIRPAAVLPQATLLEQQAPPPLLFPGSGSEAKPSGESSEHDLMLSSWATSTVPDAEEVHTSAQDGEEDDIIIRSRSTTPPAAAHFALNPALAAQLAANHPFGGGGLRGSSGADGGNVDVDTAWIRSVHAQLSAPRDGAPEPGALVLYRPVKPKPAFVRPEDEEREDELDEEGMENRTCRNSASILDELKDEKDEVIPVDLDLGYDEADADAAVAVDVEEPTVEEADDDYFSRAQTGRGDRSRLQAFSASSRSSSLSSWDASGSPGTNGGSRGPRIIELDLEDDDGRTSSATELVPSYVCSPSSPAYSSASTIGSSISSTHTSTNSSFRPSGLHDSSSRSRQEVIDLTHGAVSSLATSAGMEPAPAFAQGTPIDLQPLSSASAHLRSDELSHTGSTPVSMSTGTTTPVSSFTPLHPSLLPTRDGLEGNAPAGVWLTPAAVEDGDGTADAAPMDLD